MSNYSRELEEKITAEALGLASHGLRRSVFTDSMVPLAVTAAMWNQIEHGVLVVWCTLMFAGIIIKYLIAVLYTKQTVDYVDVKLWTWLFSAVLLFLALLWSSTTFLFFVEGSVSYQLFIFTLLTALSVGAALGGMFWMPFFYVRAVPMMGALIIRFAIDDSAGHIALVVIFSIGLFGMTALAKALNNSMRSQIRQRHESARLNTALNEKTLEAEHATLAKSRFLAAASHDLRQPLHALSLLIDVLKHEKSEQRRQEIFSRIEMSLDALRKLFDELLDISRLDAKVVTPEFSHFDLALVLQALAGEFKSEASDKHLTLRVHADTAIVVTDRLLLERILRNIIGNAIRYTESGGVLISLRRRGDTVLMQVWDTGAGIAPQYHEEIFVEFRQLHNAHRDRSQGLGLGLAIVKRLCQLLRHPLEMRSQPGKGSVFGLRLPLGDARRAEVKEESSTPQYWDLSGRRVVVIDDERDIRDAMHTLLSRWGCQVVTADSLTEAVQALRENEMTPELIISDLRLRDGCTGVEAIDGLQTQFAATIPGILVTGETLPEQLTLARDSGYELLQKPVQPIRLRLVMQQQLSEADKVKPSSDVLPAFAGALNAE